MKQTLEEAAYDYATQKTKFRKDVLKEVDADNYVSRHADSMEDFQCGYSYCKEQSPWISVKERLPNNDENIFYTNHLSGALGVGFYVDEKWYQAYTGEDIYGITHWMPIPSFDEILEANKDVLERIKEQGD